MANVKNTYRKQLRKLVKYIEESNLICIYKSEDYIFLPERGVHIGTFLENTEQAKKGMFFVMYDNEMYSMTLADIFELIDKVEEGTLV